MTREPSRPGPAGSPAATLGGIVGGLEQVEIRGHRLRTSVDGQGPPLLLINGLGASLELWQPLRAQLPGRRTLAFDAPGAGGSPTSGVPLRMNDLADLVSELLTHFGYDAVDVLGYSFGGAVAQELARRHPSRVRRLVLAGTIPGLGGIQNPTALFGLFTLLMRRQTEARTAAAARIVGGETARDPAMRAWVARAHATHPPRRSGLTSQLRTMLGWSSLPWLHRIDAPTLALTGARDRLAPPVNSRIFMSRIPNCQARVIPGGGHLFLIDQASDAAPVIEAFLAAKQRPARGDGSPGRNRSGAGKQAA